jgi:hypothetical protein
VPDQVPCAEVVRINHAMAYPLNCDSAAFMQLAHHPRQVLQPGNMRQSRPGYVALGAAATRVVAPAARLFGIDHLYHQTDSAYLALVLINFLAVAGGVALLAWLLARIGTPLWASVAICALLAVNDVVKAFYWTPHQQMFLLLVPVVTIAIARWVLLSRPSWPLLAATGLGLGLASLVYGSVLITAGVVLVVLLLRGWRGLVTGGVFAGAFAVPQLAWVAVCTAVAGSYYNHDVTAWHEFVWLPQAAMRGWGPLTGAVTNNAVAVVREFASMGGLALLVIGCLAVVGVALRVRLRPDTAEARAVLFASALTVAVSIGFGWGIGVIATRLVFPAVPGLLVGIGWLAARLSGRSRTSGVATGVALSLVALGVLVVALTARGPYV